jgi:PTH2 family peptidyl-tRNA hydrolase
VKQVIVVNEALKLPRGKLAAQVAHASVAALLETQADARRAWLQSGMPKVVLRCESEQELLALEAAAERGGLPNALIRDAGHTVLDPGTVTCLGLGPAKIEAIDALTGELKLVR